MHIKKSKGISDYNKNAKKYVVNMIRKSRCMHIKNCKSCNWSKFLQEYVDFDTEEEALSSGIDIKKCKRCFKDN